MPFPLHHAGRRLRLVACLFLVMCAIAAPRADAATWYVAPAGNDSNAGTESAPFRTIQRAANVVNPGDTVIVEDGTYTGIGTGTSCASSSRPVVCLSRGGTSSAWVTFKARNKHGAKVDGANNASTHGFRFLSTANYVRIEGFDIFGMGNTTAGSSGIVIYSGGHHVVIADNRIHDIGRLCTDHVYGMNGIFVQNAYVTIERNMIYDIGRFAPGQNGCSPSSSNYQNHDHGIYVNGKNDGSAPGAREVTIVNNRFIAIERGWPIQLYPDPVAALRVLHNTFTGANPYRTGHIILAANTSGARIQNNIFQEPTTAAINFSAGTHTDLVIGNNLTSGPISTTKPSGVTFSSNIEYADAQLDPETAATLSSSPAIDKGVTLSTVVTDHLKRPRPAGASSDIGADEPGGSTSPEPEPTPEPTPTPTPTDTTAPTLTITSPRDGGTVYRTVAIEATASDNVGVVRVEFFVDGSRISTDQSSPYTASWNAKRASRGTHTITAVAYDAAGNKTSRSVSVTR